MEKREVGVGDAQGGIGGERVGRAVNLPNSWNIFDLETLYITVLYSCLGEGGGVMGWESIALMHLCTYVLFFAVRYVAKPGCDVQVTVTCCLNRDMGTNHT